MKACCAASRHNSDVVVFRLFMSAVRLSGSWTPLAPPPDVTKTAAESNPLTQFLDNIPKSLFGPLGDDGRVLSVIFLALAFGVALRRLKNQPIGNVDQLTLVAFDSLVIVLHWVLEVIPLAVFGSEFTCKNSTGTL